MATAIAFMGDAGVLKATAAAARAFRRSAISASGGGGVNHRAAQHVYFSAAFAAFHNASISASVDSAADLPRAAKAPLDRSETPLEFLIGAAQRRAPGRHRDGARD